ncbi:MAG: hypothetical protein R3346_03665 [Candidatus Spechtbacterales bacterium]|nr:hypothetical protein [Candidatus Spechtbacterales bacterium]
MAETPAEMAQVLLDLYESIEKDICERCGDTGKEDKGEPYNVCPNCRGNGLFQRRRRYETYASINGPAIAEELVSLTA